MSLALSRKPLVIFAAASLAGASMIAARPAAAAPVAPVPAAQVAGAATVDQVAWRGHHGGHHWRGGHWGGGYRHYGGGYYRHGGGWGGAAAAGIAGLATGAIIGGALSQPTYVEPGYPAYGVVEGGGDAVAYCMQRFKSYDPGSGTYLGYDGIRHPCP